MRGEGGGLNNSRGILGMPVVGVHDMPGMVES